MIKVKLVKEVKRSDGLWHFACSAFLFWKSAIMEHTNMQHICPFHKLGFSYILREKNTKTIIWQKYVQPTFPNMKRSTSIIWWQKSKKADPLKLDLEPRWCCSGHSHLAFMSRYTNIPAKFVSAYSYLAVIGHFERAFLGHIFDRDLSGVSLTGVFIRTRNNNMFSLLHLLYLLYLLYLL